MAIDSNGLFARARKAAEDWNKSVGDETATIENAMLIMNEVSGIKVESITLNTQGIVIEVGESEKLTATVLPGNATDKEVKWISQSDEIARVEDGTVTGVSKGNTTITATAGGQSATCRVEVKTVWSEEWNANNVSDGIKEEKEDGTVRKVPIPKGYTASQVAGENTIKDGLVIYEGDEPVDSNNHATALTSRNQYVWIPVDDINSMVMCKNDTSHHISTETGICDICGDTTPTPLVGKLYTSGYREPAVVTKYDGAIDASFKLGSASEFLAHLQEEFRNMAKSVAKYKGFYISRYEIQAGATSKKGATVLRNNISSNNWYGLYTTIQNSNSPEKSTVAQMIWGSQYDQVMLFVDGKNGYKVTKSNAARHDSSGFKVSGNNPNDIACNIYDLEGNCFEWTAETINTDIHIYRGRLLR